MGDITKHKWTDVRVYKIDKDASTEHKISLDLDIIGGDTNDCGLDLYENDAAAIANYFGCVMVKKDFSGDVNDKPASSESWGSFKANALERLRARLLDIEPHIAKNVNGIGSLTESFIDIMGREPREEPTTEIKLTETEYLNQGKNGGRLRESIADFDVTKHNGFMSPEFDGDTGD